MSVKNSENFNNAQIGDNNNINLGDTIFIKNYSKKIIFNETKLKELLESLNDQISGNEEKKEELLADESNYKKIDRDMVKKNKKHNLTEDNYKSIIIPQMDKYHSEIEKFFKNTRNKKLTIIYEQILARFNVHLRTNGNKYESILNFFDKLTQEMHQEHREYLEKLEDDFHDILLYYMYYMCDLDKGE